MDILEEGLVGTFCCNCDLKRINAFFDHQWIHTDWVYMQEIFWLICIFWFLKHLEKPVTPLDIPIRTATHGYRGANMQNFRLCIQWCQNVDEGSAQNGPSHDGVLLCSLVLVPHSLYWHFCTIFNLDKTWHQLCAKSKASFSSGDQWLGQMFSRGWPHLSWILCVAFEKSSEWKQKCYLVMCWNTFKDLRSISC